MQRELASPALRGGLLALLAAALFGLSTPLVQGFGAGIGPFTTAALLYGGAAAVADRIGTHCCRRRGRPVGSSTFPLPWARWE